MSTFLFDKIIFGPVRSRRLGVSLGINLLPTDCKICNFDCVYCECGWTSQRSSKSSGLPARGLVREELETRLKEMSVKNEPPDVITFAGNGEPTMHPEFEGIIDDTIILRDAYCPSAGIAVLSNSTLIYKDSVTRALQKVDQNILKLDTVFESTFRLLNKASSGVELKKIIEGLQSFPGKMIIQTLFLRGEMAGAEIDNTSEKELAGLIDIYRSIHPEKIMIYTFERDTPAKGLQKVSATELSKIAERLVKEGFEVEVSA